MKRLLALTALSLLALSGCTNAPEAEPTETKAESSAPKPSPTPTAETVTPTPTPSATTPAKSPRGNIIKAVGDPFGWSLVTDGPSVAEFTVTNIEVNPVCDSGHAEPSENGYFVRLDISGHTTADLTDHMYFYPWKVVKADGVTHNGYPDTLPAQWCLADDVKLPREVGPGETVSGSVVLDVPTEHGVIILLDTWEWSY